MTHHPLIVLSLEGLATAALGCYGSSWNDTPTIDRLASGGCVWDRFLATSDQPDALWADWTGRSSGWARRYASSRGPLVLVTDGEVNDHQSTCFDEVLSLPPCSIESCAEQREVAETQFGQLVAAAIDRGAQPDPWGVLWLHSRFLTRCWDAPDEFWPDDDITRDDSPEGAGPEGVGPGQAIRPPMIESIPLDAPDLVIDWMRAYGAQIRLVDLLLELLLQNLGTEDPSVVIVGASGFRLGQGGQIGHHVGPLRSPDVQVPLVVNRGGPLHVPQLTPSTRLGSILERLHEATSICTPSQWCAPSASAPPIQIKSDRAIVAIQDAGWYYVADADHSEHLYLKPDDLDDFNDVGRLRTDVLEKMRGYQ